MDIISKMQVPDPLPPLLTALLSSDSLSTIINDDYTWSLCVCSPTGGMKHNYEMFLSKSLEEEDNEKIEEK